MALCERERGAGVGKGRGRVGLKYPLTGGVHLQERNKKEFVRSRVVYKRSVGGGRKINKSLKCR
jgi:hypothetical protein